MNDFERSDQVLIKIMGKRMKEYIVRAMLCAFAGMAMTACDDDTASLGIHDTADDIKTSTNIFEFSTRSVAMEAVTAYSNKCYLGAVHDPETDTEIKAEFAAQFHTFENYELPAKELIIKDEDGNISCDSIELRLYFSNYYGDATNPMKVYVYELDTAKVISEKQTYTTDIPLEDYVAEDAQPVAKKVFTASDYTLSDAERTSTSTYSNVHIRLPKSLGTRIMNQFFEHPEYFADSYQFIHHVCAGFLFKLQSGEGTMLSLDVSAMNLYFRYRDADVDTTYTAIARFAATPEVIQSTRFKTDDLTDIISADNDFTYLKTPAGIATEITLPVDDIFAEHENDSINRAQVVLTRLNSTNSNATDTYSIPQNILMVYKPYYNNFFANRDVTDGYRSFTTTFDSSFNTYTFSNLARLISYMRQQKLAGMKAEGLTSEQYNAAHPDWNRAIITPVTTTSVTNSYGYSTIVSVNHDLSISSVRLQGGNMKQTMQVIYSGYK